MTASLIVPNVVKVKVTIVHIVMLVLPRWFSSPMWRATEALPPSTLTSMHWRWCQHKKMLKITKFPEAGGTPRWDGNPWSSLWPVLQCEDHIQSETWFWHFYSKQILKQEPSGDPTEIANVIRHVRPGNGFEPTFPLFARCSNPQTLKLCIRKSNNSFKTRSDVNGATRIPLYQWALVRI